MDQFDGDANSISYNFNIRDFLSTATASLLFFLLLVFGVTSRRTKNYKVRSVPCSFCILAPVHVKLSTKISPRITFSRPIFPQWLYEGGVYCIAKYKARIVGAQFNPSRRSPKLRPWRVLLYCKARRLPICQGLYTYDSLTFIALYIKLDLWMDQHNRTEYLRCFHRNFTNGWKNM